MLHQEDRQFYDSDYENIKKNIVNLFRCPLIH